MASMKRLLDEEILEEDWKVLPVPGMNEWKMVCASIRNNGAPRGYRLMEHIGKGRWVERSRGTLKAMQQQADLNNKEGYHTPLKKEEVTERERFSVMERMRLVVK